jgi:ketosteroid isomerase-like protein
MPGERDVEILGEVYARWAAGDLRAGVELLDADVVSIWPSEFPTSGATLGVQGHKRAMREWLREWERLELVAERLVDARGSVVVPFRLTARGRASGVTVERRWAHVWTMRGGKVVRFEVFLSVDAAFAAAGMEEHPSR